MGAAIKLEAVLGTLKLDGEYRGRYVNPSVAVRRAVLSPSPDRWGGVYDPHRGTALMRSLARQAREIAEGKGFLGGAVAFHPWRDSRVRWTFDVEGPHFHFTGPASWLDAADDDQVGDDTWKFIIMPRWYRRVPEIFEAVAYDLTHVGVSPTRPVLTWWGAAHGRALKLDARIRDRIKAIEEGSHAVCPECNGTNTFTIMATHEELERWGVRPRSHVGRGVQDPPRQYRFVCGDCGAVEPVPEKTPGTEKIERPWRYRR